MPNAEQLADIAELYYRDGLTQKQISERTGITRTTISRMLTEARDRGIVSVTIIRPLDVDSSLSAELAGLHHQLNSATVVRAPTRPDLLLQQLGRAGARVLTGLINDGDVIGITWGRSLEATVAALDDLRLRDIRVVQLAGAVAAEGGAPWQLVNKLGSKLGAEVVSISAPLVVDSAAMARSLSNDPSNRAAIELTTRVTIALIGIGVSDETTSSLVAGGHLGRGELRKLAAAGAVGDAAGHPIDIDGDAVGDFSDRLVGISRHNLKSVRNRIAVAGGVDKTNAIHGAIVGGYVSDLVTDSATAAALVRLAKANGHEAPR